MELTKILYHFDNLCPIETNVKINLHVTNKFSKFNTDQNRSLMIQLLNDYTTNKYERVN